MISYQMYKQGVVSQCTGCLHGGVFENSRTCSPLTLCSVPALVHVHVWVHITGWPSECSAEERCNNSNSALNDQTCMMHANTTPSKSREAAGIAPGRLWHLMVLCTFHLTWIQPQANCHSHSKLSLTYIQLKNSVENQWGIWNKILEYQFMFFWSFLYVGQDILYTLTHFRTPT